MELFNGSQEQHPIKQLDFNVKIINDILYDELIEIEK